jgi:hypothetical protein
MKKSDIDVHDVVTSFHMPFELKPLSDVAHLDWNLKTAMNSLINQVMTLATTDCTWRNMNCPNDVDPNNPNAKGDADTAPMVRGYRATSLDSEDARDNFDNVTCTSDSNRRKNNMYGTKPPQ